MVKFRWSNKDFIYQIWTNLFKSDNKKLMSNKPEKEKSISTQLSQEDKDRLKEGAERFVEKYSDTIIQLAKENG